MKRRVPKFTHSPSGTRRRRLFGERFQEVTKRQVRTELELATGALHKGVLLEMELTQGHSPDGLLESETSDDRVPLALWDAVECFFTVQAAA